MYKFKPGAVDGVGYLYCSPTLLYHKTAFFPKEFHSFQIVCQRAGGAGIHCSAHTVSGYVNSSIRMHTPCACLA